MGNHQWQHEKARKIMAKEIRRELSIYECVHHIDGNPFNNNLENLMILSREEHNSIHHGGYKRKRCSTPQWNKLGKDIIKCILFTYYLGYNNSQIAKLLEISDMAVRTYINQYRLWRL